MKFFSLSASILSLALTWSARACDLCGCYLPKTDAHPAAIGFFAGVSEQFTHFGTLQFNDHEVANPSGQYLDSSISQLVIGTSFLEGRLSLQANVPFLYRSFRRPEGFAIQHGHEAGLGDASLIANWNILRREGLYASESAGLAPDGKTPLLPLRGEPRFSFSMNLFAGLKLPTGDSSRIKEEFHEVEVEGAPESGIHGHDLALGTGSYDGVFGTQLALRYRALFFQADVQYTVRGQSHYSYEFADDLSWSGGPGVYLFRGERGRAGLQCVFSGETKGTDRFQGAAAEDTGVTSLYIGPALTAEYGRISGDLGVDLPVLMNTTKLQAVPDYRLRAGFSVRF